MPENFCPLRSTNEHFVDCLPTCPWFDTQSQSCSQVVAVKLLREILEKVENLD